MNKTRISIAHLLQMAASFKGNSFMSVDMFGDAYGIRASFKGRVKKKTEGKLVLMNTNPKAYGEMVNRRLAQQKGRALTEEETFTPKQRWGGNGELVEGTPIVRHLENGNLYLNLYTAQKKKTMVDVAEAMGRTLSDADRETLGSYTVGMDSSKAGKITYYLDGNEITFAELRAMDAFTPSFLKKYDKVEGSGAEQGGLLQAFKVQIFTPKLQTITGFRLGGKDYLIEG